MTDGWRVALTAAAGFSCFVSPLLGQPAASIGVGASIVEYDGFLASGAATLTPAVQFDATNLSVGGQGRWTLFESGNSIVEATAAAAWLAPSRHRWRIELSGAAGAARYAAEPTSGHALARSRLHLFAERAGGWVGFTSGASFHDSTGVPIELALGAWTAGPGFALVGRLTGAWFARGRYVDLAGAARWTGGRVELEGRAGARPWVDGHVAKPRAGVYGEVSALVSFSTRLAVGLSAGSYPSDPVRRVLGARYATLGLRLGLTGSEAPATPALDRAMIGATLDHAASEGTSRARLEIEQYGPLYTLRVHVTGATLVELMGDFTDWQAVTLRQVGPGTWEVELPLAPGVQRLNLRVDGGQWQVPVGARPEADGFGGTVGVVVVGSSPAAHD